MYQLAFNIGDKFNSPFSTGGKTLGDLVSFIIQGSLVLAGILVIFLLIFAGLSIITSAGEAKPEGMEKAKKAASAAIIGFIFILLSYGIIRLIEILVGANFITQPGV